MSDGGAPSVARRRRRRWPAAAAVAVVAVLGVVGASLATTGGAHHQRHRLDVGAPAPSPAEVAHCPWLRPGLAPATAAAELLRALTTPDKLRLMDLVSGGPSGIYEGYTEAVPAVCMPGISEQDGSEGVASGFSEARVVHRAFDGATQLPAPIADAAAWDPALAAAYGRVIGGEAADKGIDVVLAPTVNIDRSPRWGRSYESLGEDPYLAASLAVPETKAIQAERVVAVVKHFAAYDQEDHRDSLLDDADIGSRELHEIELPTFRAVVEEAGVGGVMCSLNLIDGVPACEDRSLLSGVLRAQWHFGGFVRSDCGAVYSTVAAVAAGVAQAKCTPAYSPSRLTAALTSGAVTGAELDAALLPYLTQLFRFDLVTDPQRFHPGPASTAADRGVALRVAEEGTVLLRNRGGVLPIRAGTSVALIGPLPDGPKASGGGALFVRPSTITGASGALHGLLGARLHTDPGTDPIAAAALAARSDVAVVIVGDHDREGRDRTTLSLGAAQDRLVRDVAAANPRTVVVVESGSAVLMPWLSRTAAVLETWYHGQLGGSALADVLLGRFDPSGKLPVTFPASDREGPATTPATFGGVDGAVQFTEGIDVGYRWYEVHHRQPLFPFGFGLSYTRFRYHGLHLAPAPGGGFVASTTVRNVGPVAGADVVQLYVGDPSGTGEPPRQLRGFVRVQLAPGQSARVTMTVTPGDLASWTGAGGWQVEAGRYRVDVGDGSALSMLPLRASTTLAAASLGVDSGPAPGPPPTVVINRMAGRAGQ